MSADLLMLNMCSLLPDLKMWEVSRQAWMDRSPSKGWIVFKGYFDTLNRLKKEGDI